MSSRERKGSRPTHPSAPRSGDAPRAATRRSDDAERLLDAALARRAALRRAGHAGAWRLVHGAADGLAGFVLEQFGDVLIAQVHEGVCELSPEQLRDLAERARRATGARSVYRKRFPRDRSAALRALESEHTDPQPWLGAAAPAEFAVHEHDARFLIRPYDGYSVGLFLEQRANRGRVREQSRGRRVLNTFAYTCGFSVAAALGGARAVASVDVSKKYLEWGKRNFAANELALDGARFYCCDVLDFYERAARQGQRFDLVILDPPTFGRSRQSGRAFALRADIDPLVRGAVRLLDPGGALFLSTNLRKLSHEALLQSVAAAARAEGRRVGATERPELPADFAGDADYARTLIARIE
ncbi:MAG: class I SAM-dependent rRNA methyltransferase [Phycisphaerae bacterium]